MVGGWVGWVGEKGGRGGGAGGRVCVCVCVCVWYGLAYETVSLVSISSSPLDAGIFILDKMQAWPLQALPVNFDPSVDDPHADPASRVDAAVALSRQLKLCL